LNGRRRWRSRRNSGIGRPAAGRLGRVGGGGWRRRGIGRGVGGRRRGDGCLSLFFESPHRLGQSSLVGQLALAERRVLRLELLGLLSQCGDLLIAGSQGGVRRFDPLALLTVELRFGRARFGLDF
jgi:hypothetical protein